MPLQQLTTSLPGVGPKLAALLMKCSIHTVQDLLFHLPFRYQDRTRLTPIADLREQEWAVVQGTIISQQIRAGRRSQFTCTLQDKTHCMTLRFFHFNTSLKQAFEVGTCLRAFGQVRYKTGQFEMVHPECHVINGTHPVMMAETLTPIYSLTQGLSQTRLRQLTKYALDRMADAPLEILPQSLTASFDLSDIKHCLHYLHHPPPDANLALIEEGQHPAQLRLAFEELLAHHLSMQKLKNTIQSHSALPLPRDKPLKIRLIETLPFSLTPAQSRVIAEIEQDLSLTTPMYRLLQGDVGAGKTLVAALSCLPAIAAKSQIALMAPTELLARQHYDTFERLFSPLGISTALLTGKQTAKIKKERQVKISDGDIQIVIGTHALFQKAIHFKRLSLIIIDEQHRFGVKQRAELQSKGKIGDTLPHQLVMTATPIPRTLAMTQYAHLNISIIDELPPGRTPIQTAVLSSNKRDAVISRLRRAFKEKKQAYWVCTLIEESETLECQNAEETAALLKTELDGFKVGLVHGRMKADEKNKIMTAFANHELDLLVATTVIEVGVDVPNASLMIIENAERFGLSQLHQLRGRVGRGSTQSHCLLLYQMPLSEEAKRRLGIIRESTDGFYIAEEDLKLRGSGELIGTKQTGLMHLKIAHLQKHQSLITQLPQAVKHLSSQPGCEAKLIERWIGDKEKFISA